MLKVGIAGFGFMGRMHMGCWQKRNDAVVTTICDARPDIKQILSESIGNIEGAATQLDPESITFYTSLDEMLSNEPLDAISITLPTPLHAEAAIIALEKGLHVLCEKPMALTTQQCDAMITAAQSSRKVLQIGHCIRFWPEYTVAKDIVASQQYGPLRTASFRRLGSMPTWSSNQWILDNVLSGGMPLDLHIHDTDYILYLLGKPEAVDSWIIRDDHDRPIHIFTYYLYDNGLSVSAEGSWGMMPSFGFEMSFNMLLDRATVCFDSTRIPALQLYPQTGDAQKPQVPAGDGYTGEIAYFVNQIQNPSDTPLICPEDSKLALQLVLAEIESAQTGQTVYIT